MTLLEKLRLGFLGRSRREKLLTVLFLVVIAALWLTFFVDRVQAFGPELASLQDTAARQTEVLNDRERIDAKHATAFATLSGTERPSGKVAHETVDQIVRSSGFKFQIQELKWERRDQITFYHIDFDINGADFFKLADLYNTITTRLPTVNLSEVSISPPDRSNPTLVTARFKFVAIEINH